MEKYFFFSSRRRHTRCSRDWSSDVCSSDLILDAHPEYNIWDAREHMRQAGSFWERGWTETNGYGRANEKAGVGKLLPGAPVDFRVEKFRDRHGVRFTWRNFLQTGFAATVI